MKSSLCLLTAVLIATAAYAIQTEGPQIVKVLKHPAEKTVSKTQPGPAGLLKEEKAYMKMRMDAQPHLRPVVTHTQKGGSDENGSH